MAKKRKPKNSKRKHKKLPDIQFLRDHFDYNPITGELTDNITGDVVTRIDAQGYANVQFKGKQYRAHRICFYMFHGRDPGSKVIDHIDGNKSNNSIVNLRAVTHRVNLSNTAKARKTKPRPKNEPGAHRVWAMPV